ncbi:MAG: type VI secretion system tip protein TssI/VgrG [Pseudomonadota bacterium]
MPANPSFDKLVRAMAQHRILRLCFPHDDAPTTDLLINQLTGFESVSRGFEFTLELLSDNLAFPSTEVLGKLMSVELVRKDGTLRYFTGYCLGFSLKKVENIAFYEAKLVPWLAYLDLRKDNYLFHHQSLLQQTTSIFFDYPSVAVCDRQLQGDDPVMTDACQYDESDANYLQRRWEAAGWHYFYEHSKDGHKLILSDHSTQAAQIDGDGAIRLLRHGGAEEESAISEWSATSRVIATDVRLTQHDFKSPAPELNSATYPTTMQQGNALHIESYEYMGAYGFKDLAEGGKLSRLRMQELESGAKQFDARSNNFFVLPRRSFTLTDSRGANPYAYNPGKAAGRNEFLILEVHHTVSNNYLQDGQAPQYSNLFTCIRKAIPWRPGRGFNSEDTKILAPQTATVVGPKGQGSVHVDQYGRIRVQFHWDREGRNDESSSAWMRVVTPWAGAQSGWDTHHRVGSEVCVSYLGGNPDRPVAIGGLHNWNFTPSWSLPGQHALSGLRSRELTPTGGNHAEGRSNHLVLDDTENALQVQLKSDHLHSQLSLGHITRIEDNDGREDDRGEGFALETEGSGALRSAKGLLLTTDGRSRAVGGTLSRNELIGCLEQALALAKGLGDAAQAHEGGPRALQPQQALSAAVGALGHGAGDEATSAAATPGGQPVIAISAAAGIASATPRDQLHYAGENIDTIAGKNQQHYAMGDILHTAANSIEHFAVGGELRLIASKGKLIQHAQQDELHILARKVLRIISEDDWLELRGKKGIRLHGANSMLEISERVQFFTQQPVLFNGNLETLGPKYVAQACNERAFSLYDQEVRMLQMGDEPAPRVEFEMLHQDGHLINGKTAACGTTQVQKGTGLDIYTIRYQGELP